jgi:hypothetical protein
MMKSIMIIYLQVRLLGSAPLVPYMRKAVTVTQEAGTTPQIDKIIFKPNKDNNEGNEEQGEKEGMEEKIEKKEKVEKEGNAEKEEKEDEGGKE